LKRLRVRDIVAYSRSIPESVRRKDDTRKKQREAKKERKELEKKQKVEEIKRIKNLKKQEIEDRLNMINHYAGVNTSLNDKYLEEEFDPEKHEQLMEKIFDDEYYEEPDENVKIDNEYKAHNDENTNTIDIEKIETAAEEPIGIREGAPGDWWMCDGCGNGIMEGKWRFDCIECENFTLCDVCRTQVVHDHRLKKLKVPIGCRPPSDIVHILCDICGEDITNKDRFDCTKCSDFSVCEVCKPNATHEHPLKAASEALWNELYNLDYEDMIGDVPCRFKYRKVDAEDYGLDDKDILTWDDSMLNQYISLKKLAPYKEDPKLSRKKLKRKYNYFKVQMKQKRKEEKSKKAPEVNARLNSYGINE
jgi:protein KRI1